MWSGILIISLVRYEMDEISYFCNAKPMVHLCDQYDILKGAPSEERISRWENLGMKMKEKLRWEHISEGATHLS